MKSEHRHELQTNELGKVATRVGSSLEGYGNAIMIGLIVVALVGAGLLWWTRSRTFAGAEGWTQLTTAQTVEDFGNIADEYPQAAVGAWARLREAETHLETGIRLMFSNRESAQADLKRAREAFEKVLARESGATDEIRERALFGLARTLEATSDGDTAPAIEVYQRLLSEFPNSPYKPVAEERVATLGTEGAQQFYAWFAKEKPARPDRGGLPRDVPFDLDNLPPHPTPGGPAMTPPPLPQPPAGAAPGEAAPSGEQDPARPADAAAPENARPPAEAQEETAEEPSAVEEVPSDSLPEEQPAATPE